MSYCGYIIMIIVDSCMIWFHFDCIMQLKNIILLLMIIAEKRATTFGNLPDYLCNLVKEWSVSSFTHILTRSGQRDVTPGGDIIWEFWTGKWLLCRYSFLWHYCDVIVSMMASQITAASIIYLAVFFRRWSNKTSKLRVTGLCEGNSPATGRSFHKG